MKTKLAWLALGILLGAGVTQQIEYREVTLPDSRAFATASASVAAAQKTIAAVRAEQLAQQSGFTIIEEIAPAPAQPVSPNNGAAMALNVLGGVTGRNLSGVAALLPSQAPAQSTWYGFAIRGRVQPLFTPGTTPSAPQARYTFCATEKSCTSPAVIPTITQADLAVQR